MNCRDFRRKLDQLLDVQTRPSAIGPGAGPRSSESDSRPAVEDWEPALRDHLAGCDGCRQMAARYHVLRRALRAWTRPPVPPADLADRIVAAAQVPASL